MERCGRERKVDMHDLPGRDKVFFKPCPGIFTKS